MPNTRQLMTKVPAVTAYFWIIKVLSTTVGETFADYLNSTLGFGLTGTTWAMTAVLAVLLAVQFSTRRYLPAVYWPTIVAISTVGTLITDSMHDGLGVENWQAIIGFGLALIATFVLWFRREGTLQMKSINSRSREAFYWVAILMTFALGTAGGDIFLDDFGLPLLSTFIGFAVAIALVTLAWRLKWLGGVSAFWIAYVLTRPLGAALGDLLSQPRADTGLGLGATTTSLIFLVAIAALVSFLGITKRDQIK